VQRSITPKFPMRPAVQGVDLDPQTRCGHYHSALDIVALKLRCCRTYYACRECHDELAAHLAEVWPISERDQTAILCGACGSEMSIRAYLDSNDRCPACAAPFNPGCRKHYHLYFEVV
jgi:uncharacterized CHY-type Zn-finger protein